MNSQLEKSEEQKVQDSASLCTDNVNHNDDMMINMISIVNLAETLRKNSLTNHLRRNRNALFVLQ